MNREELKAYLDAQIEEIQKYKWISSEREQRDIGFNRAALEWIERYGEQFYQHWSGRKHADGHSTN
ncbi:hypothetical protein LLG95_10345 [bacterium]|nr:hypothetical protein [bacterium]